MPRLDALVFDWGGTLVDHGCIAPVAAFVELFRRQGVTVAPAVVRRGMGGDTGEHLRQLCELPEVHASWVAAYGQRPGAGDVAALTAQVAPLLARDAATFAEPIPGVSLALADLQQDGRRIGVTSARDRGLLDEMLHHAAEGGLRVDVSVAADEVRRPAPAPDACWAVAAALGAEAARRCVMVGDTPVDIEAGRNAGFWTVGVALTGNETGLTAAELALVPDVLREELRSRATRRLMAAGAHRVIDSVVDIIPILDEFEWSLGKGEGP